MQDIAKKKYEERCAKDMRMKDMQERARKEQNKESTIKEETPKIIKKAEVEIEWIHTIIERQQDKREQQVILQKAMMICRENVKDQLKKYCPSTGRYISTNMINLYIKYTRAGLSLKRREKDKEKEEGYMELEGPRESQGQVPPLKS